MSRSCRDHVASVRSSSQGAPLIAHLLPPFTPTHTDIAVVSSASCSSTTAETKQWDQDQLLKQKGELMNHWFLFCPLTPDPCPLSSLLCFCPLAPASWALSAGSNCSPPRRHTRSGDMTQWLNTCFACVESWVQSPALQKPIHQSWLFPEF